MVGVDPAEEADKTAKFRQTTTAPLTPKRFQLMTLIKYSGELRRYRTVLTGANVKYLRRILINWSKILFEIWVELEFDPTWRWRARPKENSLLPLGWRGRFRRKRQRYEILMRRRNILKITLSATWKISGLSGEASAIFQRGEKLVLENFKRKSNS